MSFAARQAERENDLLVVKDGKVAGVKGQSLLQQGSKRRAPLGDMSNVAAASTRAQLGKDAGPVKAAVKAPITRSRAAAAASGAEPTASGVPSAAGTAPAARSGAPRTRSQTRGLGLSSVLQTRSEAAAGTTAKRQSAPLSPPLPDIDAIDRDNPMAMTEYVNDIYTYYRRVEPRFRVAHDYMKNQTDINEKMRAILVDWLEEVHLKFKLLPETMFLAVNLIDRFLSQKQVTRRNLQLIGVTAMLVASKYEEIWAPEVRDFVYISDKAYTRDQILECEKLMLNTLKWNLTLPTCYNFLARFLKAAAMQLDRHVSLLASYVVELSLIDASMLRYPYSTVAAAAVFIALRATDADDAYPRTLARHSGLSLESVLPCAAALVESMQKAPTNTLAAVYKKYSHSRCGEVAKVAPPAAIIQEAAALMA